MYLHKMVYKNICDCNMDYYNEYISEIKDDFIKIIKNIKTIKIFENSKDIINLRQNVHKLISLICYLDRSDDLLHLCKYVLHQPKDNITNPDLFNYKYYVDEILSYDYSKIF